MVCFVLSHFVTGLPRTLFSSPHLHRIYVAFAHFSSHCYFRHTGPLFVSSSPSFVPRQANNKPMVKLLLRWGAEINAQNKQGQTPLHFCFAFQFDQLGAYLIEKGALDSIKNFFGCVWAEACVNYFLSSTSAASFSVSSRHHPYCTCLPSACSSPVSAFPLFFLFVAPQMDVLRRSASRRRGRGHLFAAANHGSACAARHSDRILADTIFYLSLVLLFAFYICLFFTLICVFLVIVGAGRSVGSQFALSVQIAVFAAWRVSLISIHLHIF